MWNLPDIWSNQTEMDKLDPKTSLNCFTFDTYIDVSDDERDPTI